MAKRKYTQHASKPLGYVLKQRRDFYVSRLSKAFEGFQQSLPQVLELAYHETIAKLERAYNRGNLSEIEKAERGILGISKKLGKVNEAASGLASVIGYDEGKPARELVREAPAETRQTIDERPRLTYYQFAKAVKAGMNYEQIKAKFRLRSNYQMGGFAKALKQRTQAAKKKK